MIGLDTNVLVRYFAQDDPHQSAKVNALFATFTPEHKGFVSLLTLAELAWVLRRAFHLDRQELASVIEKILNSQDMTVEQAEVCWSALHLFLASRADFSDCLMERSCRARGCDYTVTFDSQAAKSAGMRLLR